MAEEKVREVKGPGPRGQRGAPRPKIKNPMKLFGRIMRYIFQYYSIQMILVVVCIVVSVLANVQGTLFTKTLIDQYIQPMIGQSDPSYAPLAGAMLRVACFYAIGVAAAFLQAKIMVYVNQGTLRRLREDRHFQNPSYLSMPQGFLMYQNLNHGGRQ